MNSRRSERTFVYCQQFVEKMYQLLDFSFDCIDEHFGALWDTFLPGLDL